MEVVMSLLFGLTSPRGQDVASELQFMTLISKDSDLFQNIELGGIT